MPVVLLHSLLKLLSRTSGIVSITAVMALTSIAIFIGFRYMIPGWCSVNNSVNATCVLIHTIFLTFIFLWTLSHYFLSTVLYPGIFSGLSVLGSTDNHSPSCGRVCLPGGHHCSVCQLFVHDMDHHCPLISNCVSGVNKRNFLSAVAGVLVAASYGVIMSQITALLTSAGQRHDPSPMSSSHRSSVLSPLFSLLLTLLSSEASSIFFLFTFSMLVMALSGGLLLFHLYLYMSGINTTRAFFKNSKTE